MNKPNSIKFVKAIIILKLFLLSLMAFFIILGYILKPHNNLNNGFFYSFLDGFLSVDNLYSTNIEALGRNIGAVLYTSIFIILSLVFLNKKMYKSLLIVFILQILQSFNNVISLLISLLLLIIVTCNKNAKNYFK